MDDKKIRIMKRGFSFVSALLTILLFPAVTNAETRIGVRGAFNSVENSISAVNTETVLHDNSYNGFEVGGVLQSHYKSGMGIEIAGLYSQSGLQLPDKAILKQNSIIVPINMKMFFGLADNFDLFIYGGPQIRLNVGETAYTILNGDDIQEYVLNKATVSLNAGAGVMMGPHLQVFANYNWQVQNLGSYSLSHTDNSTTIELGRNPIRNRSLQLGATLFF